MNATMTADQETIAKSYGEDVPEQVSDRMAKGLPFNDALSSAKNQIAHDKRLADQAKQSPGNIPAVPVIAGSGEAKWKTAKA